LIALIINAHPTLGVGRRIPSDHDGRALIRKTSLLQDRSDSEAVKLH